MRYPSRGAAPWAHPRQIALEKIPSRFSAFCNGARTDQVFAGLPVWQNPTPPLPTDVGRKVSIISTSTADTVAGGAGARTVLIGGFNELGDYLEEVVPLAGTGSSETTKEFLIVHSMRVINVGSSGLTGANTGVITGTFSGGPVAVVMPAGKGIQQHGHYRVPMGFQACVKQIHISGFQTGVLYPLRHFDVIKISNTSNSVVQTVLHNENLQTSMTVFEPHFIIDELETIALFVVGINATATGVYSRMHLQLSRKGT